MQYFPVRSPESDDFADGKITIEEYLDHTRDIAEEEVSTDDDNRRHRLDRTERMLRRVAVVTFLVVVPAAYVVTGLFFLTDGTRFVSITTGVLIALVALAVIRWRKAVGAQSRS